MTKLIEEINSALALARSMPVIWISIMN